MGDTTEIILKSADGGIQLKQADVDLVKNSVAKGATDQELMMYLGDCLRRNVHPLDKMIHFTAHTDKFGKRSYTPITSIDFFRMRAESSGAYAGNDDPVYIYDGKQLKSATSTVYKVVQGIRCPFTATARWEQYLPSGSNKQFMWLKMPELMLGKCAEALALRKAFPGQLNGLYAKEEMDQADYGTKETKPTTVEAQVKQLAAVLDEKIAPPPAQEPMPVAVNATVEQESPKVEAKLPPGVDPWDIDPESATYDPKKLEAASKVQEVFPGTVPVVEPDGKFVTVTKAKFDELASKAKEGGFDKESFTQFLDGFGIKSWKKFPEVMYSIVSAKLTKDIQSKKGTEHV